MKYLFALQLVNKNGQRIKSIFLNTHFLSCFEPSEDRRANCDFCTKYLTDYFKECRAYFKGLKGELCLEILEIETGTYIAGSDFIGGWND